MAGKHYDLIVIGTGTAANVTAMGCSKAGWSVAVIDHRPFGGTCPLRGCDPKKMMVAAAEAMDGVRRMGEKDVVRGDVHIDWPSLQRFKRSYTDIIPDKLDGAYDKRGIDAYRGPARFTGRSSVDVDGRVLEGRHVVIATGAESVHLPIDGAEHLTMSDEFLELKRLPRRIALVGGGYIGFEFAHIAAHAGAEVTVINRSDRPLAGFDPDLVDALVARTRALGVAVKSGHEVESVEREGDAFAVHARGPEGPAVIHADLVVHSAGRVPAVVDLDLDVAEIAHEGPRLALTEHLQSVSNPAVYAAGDAAATALPLTPVAALEGKAVVANLLKGERTTVDYSGIPSTVFTLPPLARVGLLEKEAREQGLKYRVSHKQASGWYAALRINEPCYAFKILVEEGSDRVLGAHLVGPEAAEVINLFGFAMRSGLSAAELAHAVFAYPTVASDIESMLP